MIKNEETDKSVTGDITTRNENLKSRNNNWEEIKLLFEEVSLLIKGEEWTSPELLNGWENVVGKPAGFMKDGLGFVHLKGNIKGGTSGIMFNLPEGYRPETVLEIPTLADEKMVRLGIISSNGALYPNSTAENYYSLDGISFKAAK